MRSSSSKHAAARAGKELTLAILHWLAKGYLLDDFPSKDISKKVLNRRVYELHRLKFAYTNHGQNRITKKGLTLLSEEKVWALKIPIPPAWDKRWHLVLFDIPTNRKKYRDIFRLRIRELGLQLYQDSVWISPYPMEKQILSIAQFYFIDSYVSFAEVTTISGEERLKQKFKLK